MTPNELFGSSTLRQNQGSVANNNDNYVSFDEIENAFKTPTQRQDYYEHPASPSPMGDLSGLADPSGDAFHDFEQIDDEPTPIDPEKAHRTGMRIARIVDTGIDFTLSNIVARNGESYKADERDLQDIAECWGEIAQDKGWNIGPEWSLIILYIMVYGPLVKQAMADRRMAEMEARQDAMQAQLNTIQMQQVAQQQQQQPQPQKQSIDGTSNPQPDTKPSPYTYQPAQ